MNELRHDYHTEERQRKLREYQRDYTRDELTSLAFYTAILAALVLMCLGILRYALDVQ